MVAAAALLSFLALVALVAVALSMRTVVKTEERSELHLLDPLTHTVVYTIPTGIDPVVFAGALSKGGYHSMVEDGSTAQALRVECDGAGREEVRRVIEGVALDKYAGAGLKLGHVVFEDER